MQRHADTVAVSALIELAELFLPNRCLLCGGRTLGVLCSSCSPKLPPPRTRCPVCYEPSELRSGEERCDLCTAFPFPARRLRYLWEYGGIYRELIQTIKYRPSRRLGVSLSSTVAVELTKLFDTIAWDLIVPVPTARRVLLRRGFNQSGLLAERISKEFRIPWSVFALSHVGYRSQQADLDRKKRFANVKSALRASRSIVSNRSILLVDDVWTTGSTAGIACIQLLNAGAREIDVFTIARASNWTSSRADIHGKLYSLRHENPR